MCVCVCCVLEINKRQRRPFVSKVDSVYVLCVCLWPNSLSLVMEKLYLDEDKWIFICI